MPDRERDLDKLWREDRLHMDRSWRTCVAGIASVAVTLGLIAATAYIIARMVD